MDHVNDADHEQAMLQAWEKGEDRGFTDVVARYLPLIYARCRRALGAGDADDATQAVFLVLARKRAQAVASPVLAAWLLKVAENVIRNARRDLARRRRAESSAPQPHTTEEATMRDIKDHLDDALARLPADERTAIQLHLLAGHTLAEVAAHEGSPLRTVHARIQRGLDRLRTGLIARGVPVGGLALATALQAEAATMVPASLTDHLGDLTPAGGDGGAVSVVSARALRWSRQGTPFMLPLITIGSTLLLGVGAAVTAFHLPAPSATNESGRMSLTSPGVVGTDAVATSPPLPVAPAPPAPLRDPAHIHAWYVLNIADGARTAARLELLPEIAVIPADLKQPWLDGLRSVRSAEMAADLVSVLSPTERMALLLDSERTTETSAMDPTNVEGATTNLTDTFMGVRLPTMRGWLHTASEDAPALLAIRDVLSGGTLAGMPVTADADGWVVQARENRALVRMHGARLEWSADADAAARSSEVPAALMQPGHPEADVEMRMLEDDGTGSGSLTERLTLTLRVADDGIRLALRTHASATATGKAAPAATAPLPVVDRAIFSRMPADALFGAVLALSPESSAGNEMLNELRKELAAPLPPPPATTPAAVPSQKLPETVGVKGSVLVQVEDTRRLLSQALDAIFRIDGQARCWVQPGTPIPTLSILVDMPSEAAQPLLTSLGAPAGGESITYGALTIGWRDGTLICTTRPDGLAGVSESGGFGKHPEVQRAFAAMSQEPVGFCAILRPEALIAQALPFAAMLMPDDQQRLLTTYHHGLRDAKAFGFLTTVSSQGGTRVDAGGLLALIAGAMVGRLLAEPEMLLRAIN